MALRTILKRDTDEESLRKKSRPVTVFNERLHQMLDDMVDTLKDSGGVGLAGPQVGILRRIVVIEREDGSILELVNPEVIATEGEQEGLEGCLSLPGIWGEVKRPMTVTVRAMDRDGNTFTETASGLIGRCFVHECEHLDGILFVDRADRILTEEELEQMEAEEA
jgi:peptide deformylase